MRRIAIVLSTATLSFGMATASLAADLPGKAAPVVPVVAPFSWTGFYIGANGGCGAKNESSSASFVNDDPTDAGSFFSFGRNGGGDGCFGGFQGGYNYQFSGAWVIGIEGDWQWASINRRGSINEVDSPTNIEPLSQYESKLRDFGTLRGRLGYALTDHQSLNWLVYVTGGWAWGSNQVSGISPDFATPLIFSNSQNINGWTVGAGIEAAMNRNWSVKFEYLYLDFGSTTYNGALITDDGNTPGPLSLNTKVHTVKLGVNYRFGDLWGKAPVY